MAKKMSLKLAYQSPFMVYAVFSEQKCYRLAWLLNNGTDCEFIKLEDFRFPYHEENPKSYSLYGFHNSVFRMNVFLLENQSNDLGSLIKGNPPINFLLIFANIAGIYDIKTFLKKVRSVEGIQAVSHLGAKLYEKHGEVFYDLEVSLSAHKYL